MARLLTPLLLAVLVTAGCVPADGGSPDGTGTTAAAGLDLVRIGTGPERESLLLAHVLRELLEAADIAAEVGEFADSRDARQALELGAVQIRPAYTGETLLEVMGRGDPPSDPRSSFARVREFDERNGILWVRPVFAPEARVEQRFDVPPANATFAFVTRGPPAVDADLATLSQLARRLAEQPEAKVCVDREFAQRRDGLQAVLDAYRVPYEPGDERYLAATPTEAVRGVSEGDCLAGLTTATDGEAWAFGLQPLVDDLEVFPAFVVAPQVTEEARAIPELVPAIAPMTAHLTTRRLGGWNARVAAGEMIETVAEDAAVELLTMAGRIPTEPATEPATEG